MMRCWPGAARTGRCRNSHRHCPRRYEAAGQEKVTRRDGLLESLLLEVDTSTLIAVQIAGGIRTQQGHIVITCIPVSAEAIPSQVIKPTGLLASAYLTRVPMVGHAVFNAPGGQAGTFKVHARIGSGALKWVTSRVSPTRRARILCHGRRQQEKSSSHKQSR
jgi:hypothetical protein